MSNVDLIAVTEIKSAMEGFTGTFEDRCRKAFRESQETMFCADDEFAYRTGLAWILSKGCETDEEKERAEYTMDSLRALVAATSGVPVDLGAVLRDDVKPYPFQKWFQEES